MLLTIAEFCPVTAPVCEVDPTLPVCEDVELPFCEELLGDVLAPLCDDGLLVCDPVVDCEEVVPLIPGLALVEPWVEGDVLCDPAVLPVLPVCEDEVVPIWFWSGLEVEVLALSSSPAVERCALGLLDV